MGKGDYDVKLGGDAKDLLEEQKKALRGFSRLEKKMDKFGKKSKKAGKAGKGAMASIKDNAMGAVAGIGTVTVALGVAKRAAEALHQERKKAAGVLKEAEMGFGKLAQISGGDPKKLDKLIKEAIAHAKLAGVKPEVAADWLFEFKSTGVKEEKLFSRLYGIIQDPGKAGADVKTIQSIFGKKEAGGERQVLSKLLFAAGESKTSFAEMAPAATASAELAKAIGSTDEEFLAILSRITIAKESAKVASTQIGAFSAVVAKEGLGGRGLKSAVMEISEEGFFKKKLYKVAEKSFQKEREKLLGEEAPELVSTKKEREELSKQFDYRKKVLLMGKPGEKRDIKLEEMERRYESNRERLLDKESDSKIAREEFEDERQQELKALKKKHEAKKTDIATKDKEGLLQQFFGRKEAVLGYKSMLTDMKGIKEMEKKLTDIDVTAATRPGEDLASRTAIVRDKNAFLVAAKTLRVKKVTADISVMEMEGVKQLEREAAVHEVRGRAEGDITRLIRTARASLAEMAGFSPETVEKVGEHGALGLMPGVLGKALAGPLTWGSTGTSLSPEMPEHLKTEMGARGGKEGIEAQLAETNRLLKEGNADRKNGSGGPHLIDTESGTE